MSAPRLVTELPAGAEPHTGLSKVQLSQVELGQTIEIMTGSGAHYWITPVVGRRTIGDKIYGLQISTDSKTTERFPRSPLEVRADNRIVAGRPWNLGNGDQGRTSPVVSIRYVGA